MTFQPKKLSLVGIALLFASVALIFLSKITVNQVAFNVFLHSQFESVAALNAFTSAAAVVGYALVAVGACIFVYVGWRSHFVVDAPTVKRQLRVLIVAAAVLLVTLSLFSTEVASANSLATTGYYLATPYSPYDWLIGNFSSGQYYAINGSNWANMMTWPTPAPWADYAGNSTQVIEAALAATTAGVVYLKEVPFDLALMNNIPSNVKVVCSYGDEQYTYINSADSLGSPYTVSVGAGVNNGYFTAEDKAQRICYANAAINTVLTSLNANGTHIKLNSMNAELTATFELLAKSDIVIEGKDASVVTLYTTMNDALIQIRQSSDITISGITLLGDGEAAKTEQRGIQLYDQVDNVRIEKNVIKDMGYDGVVALYDVNNLKVLDNYVSGSKDDGINIGGGGGVPGTTNSLVQGNYVTDIAKDGIHISVNSSYTTASDNHVVNCAQTGIGIYDSKYNIIDGNQIENCYSGIQTLFGTCSFNMITNNLINVTTTSNGISLAHTAHYCSVIGNTILSPATYGVNVVNSGNIQITGNTLYAGTRAIYISGWYVNVANNNIYQPTTYGIVVSGAGAGNCTITGNLIRFGITTSAIYLAGSYNVVSSNIIEDTTSGTSIGETAENDYNIIFGNTCLGKIITTVGGNTKVNLCYNGTVWIP